MNPPRIAVLIPARFRSTRYPGKPLVSLRGVSGKAKPLIQRSWEAASRVPGVDSIHVATDHPAIADAAAGFGAEVLMTSTDCRNGTERCADALRLLAETPDIVVNVQGDAPLTPPHFVTALIDTFAGGEAAAVATPCVQVSWEHLRVLMADEAAGRVGGTTTVGDSTGRALYFSKRLIPHVPASAVGKGMSPVRLHIGVYAYTPDALRAYAAAPPSLLEELEGLEQLRFLDRAMPVRLVDVAPQRWRLWEVNNPGDVAPVEQALVQMGVE